MLKPKEEAADAPKTQIEADYEIGDAVKVHEGPFTRAERVEFPVRYGHNCQMSG